jgi:hypothetical protein
MLPLIYTHNKSVQHTMFQSSPVIARLRFLTMEILLLPCSRPYQLATVTQLNHYPICCLVRSHCIVSTRTARKITSPPNSSSVACVSVVFTQPLCRKSLSNHVIIWNPYICKIFLCVITFTEMDSVSRYEDTVSGKNFKYFVHVSCTFLFLFQKSILEIHKFPQNLFRITYLRGRQTTKPFFLFQMLPARDTVQLTWLITLISFIAMWHHIDVILRI